MPIGSYPEAKLFYESFNGTLMPDSKTGLAARNMIPLQSLKLSQYDVSASPIVIIGCFPSIIEALTILFRSGSNHIYTNENYGTIKISINEIFTEFQQACHYPVASATINNFSYLLVKGATGGVLNSLSVIKDASECGIKIPVPTIMNKAFRRGGSMRLVKSTVKSIAKLSTEIKKNADGQIKISDAPCTSLNIKELAKNISIKQKIKVECQKMLMTKYVINICSDFNRNTAGLIIDLECRRISIDALICFFDAFSEGVIVNSFSSTDV